MSTRGKMDLAVKQLLQKQLRWMELFTERLSTLQQTSQETKLCTPEDADSVRHFITEFHNDEDVKSTSPKWFTCYKDLFIVYLKKQVDDWKVRLLLRKLGSVEHDWYSKYILPKHHCFDILHGY